MSDLDFDLSQYDEDYASTLVEFRDSENVPDGNRPADMATTTRTSLDVCFYMSTGYARSGSNTAPKMP